MRAARSPSRALTARAVLALATAAALCALAGCGKGAGAQSPAVVAREAGLVSHETVAGTVGVVTKNTTRLGGADAASDAAAVARTVFPAITSATQPSAVVLVDERDWPAALAASSLASAPLGAAILYSEGRVLPSVSAQALTALRPAGAAALGGAQVVAIGASGRARTGASALDVLPEGASAAAQSPAETAAAIERVLVRARGSEPRSAIVVDLNAPRALQMPAAGLAAESGAPIVFIDGGSVPPPTEALLARLHRPALYLVGASAAAAARTALARLGRVTVIEAPGQASHGGLAPQSASENAIAVSRYGSGSFGWNVHEAGHGLVFANASRPLDAPAAAPLSAHGDFAPLLVLEARTAVPTSLARYLANIQPGYSETVPPVRSVYNHAWLIGDERAVSVGVQAQLDAMLEVTRRSSTSEEATLGPGE
ncbi:MAG TPA: hypothetical protein VH115_08230 [Solirubrobacteraceae bacterium]|nr:hypothetical protein [Solirubrobacteraceae bacterium]